MIKRLLNKLGLFVNWIYYNKVKVFASHDYHEDYYRYRFCAITGKLQSCYLKYDGGFRRWILVWETVIGKPRFINIDGVWCVVNQETRSAEYI